MSFIRATVAFLSYHSNAIFQNDGSAANQQTTACLLSEATLATRVSMLSVIILGGVSQICFFVAGDTDDLDRNVSTCSRTSTQRFRQQMN